MVDYIDDKELGLDETVLEITCGEAPFLTTRYEIETGKEIPLDERAGVIDRKLRRIKSNWFKNALKVYQSSYGYELQAENVVIARINLFITFIENYYARLKRMPSKSECKQIMTIISWNIWQMDGLHPNDETIMDWKNNQIVSWAEISKDEKE